MLIYKIFLSNGFVVYKKFVHHKHDNRFSHRIHEGDVEYLQYNDNNKEKFERAKRIAQVYFY